LDLWKTLGITDEDLKVRIITSIHQLTGGVPRLVSFALKVLMRGKGDIGHLIRQMAPESLKLILRQLLYNVFTHGERSNVLASSEILASPTTMALCLRLLVLSLKNKVCLLSSCIISILRP